MTSVPVKSGVHVRIRQSGGQVSPFRLKKEQICALAYVPCHAELRTYPRVAQSLL